MGRAAMRLSSSPRKRSSSSGGRSSGHGGFRKRCSETRDQRPMTIPAIHEDDAEGLGLPGRHLRWLVSKDAVNAKNCSACVIHVAPGEKVRPAHSRPNGEEVIYIIKGSGRV